MIPITLLDRTDTKKLAQIYAMRDAERCAKKMWEHFDATFMFLHQERYHFMATSFRDFKLELEDGLTALEVAGQMVMRRFWTAVGLHCDVRGQPGLSGDVPPGKSTLFIVNPQMTFKGSYLMVVEGDDALVLEDVKVGNQSATITHAPMSVSHFRIDKWDELERTSQLDRCRFDMPPADVGLYISVLISNPTAKLLPFQAAIIGQALYENSIRHGWRQ